MDLSKVLTRFVFHWPVLWYKPLITPLQTEILQDVKMSLSVLPIASCSNLKTSQNLKVDHGDLGNKVSDNVLPVGGYQPKWPSSINTSSWDILLQFDGPKFKFWG